MLGHGEPIGRLETQLLRFFLKTVHQTKKTGKDKSFLEIGIIFLTIEAVDPLLEIVSVAIDFGDFHTALASDLEGLLFRNSLQISAFQ